MSFTYRENQNTPLTWAQLDGNFREVESVQRDVLNQVEVAKVAAESAAESSTVSQLSAELAEEMARISVVRWCGNSTTPPTTRLDGSPLEISDEYGNLTDHLRYNWTGTAWVALNSSAQQLEERISDPAVGSQIAAWAAKKSDLSTIHLYELTHLVTDRPNPADKTTWDWSPAIQALWDYSAANGVTGIQPKGLFRYKTQLAPKSGMDIHGSKGAELRWAGSATYAIFSTTAIDGLAVKKVRFSTETGAQLWYSSAASGAIENLSLVKCYFDFSGATQTGYLMNGVRFDNVDGADLKQCKFSGGWRDHAFNSGSPGGFGGNNTARDLEIRGQNVRVLGGKHRNSWSCQYFGNVTNLISTENDFQDTADTAIFERCTSGISINKRITRNTFKNIGKSAIKTLDSNNMDTTNKGYISEVSHNTVENWGLYIDSGAILAGTGFTTSYEPVPDRDYMCGDLTIEGNTFKGTGAILFQVYNILNVKYIGNTIDVSADVLFGAYCDGMKITDANVIRTSGRISLFSSTRVLVSDSDFESPGAFTFLGSASQPFTGVVRFKGNHVKCTSVTPPDRYFGVGIVGGAFNVTAIVSDNVFETVRNFEDASESGSYNFASFAIGAGSAWVMTDNIGKFADGSKTQVQMLGDIASPVYYSGSKGSAKIISTGTIRFSESNTRNDFGAITYAP